MPLPRRDESAFSRRSDVVALAGLLLVLVVFAARSWLAWGHSEDDYGREMWTSLAPARRSKTSGESAG